MSILLLSSTIQKYAASSRLRRPKKKERRSVKSQGNGSTELEASTNETCTTMETENQQEAPTQDEMRMQDQTWTIIEQFSVASVDESGNEVEISGTDHLPSQAVELRFELVRIDRPHFTYLTPVISEREDGGGD